MIKKVHVKCHNNKKFFYNFISENIKILLANLDI